MPSAVTFTTSDLLALASRASVAGNHALASLINAFADRPGPRTDYLIRTVIEGEGL